MRDRASLKTSVPSLRIRWTLKDARGPSRSRAANRRIARAPSLPGKTGSEAKCLPTTSSREKRPSARAAGLTERTMPVSSSTAIASGLSRNMTSSLRVRRVASSTAPRSERMSAPVSTEAIASEPTKTDASANGGSFPYGSSGCPVTSQAATNTAHAVAAARTADARQDQKSAAVRTTGNSRNDAGLPGPPMVNRPSVAMAHIPSVSTIPASRERPERFRASAATYRRRGPSRATRTPRPRLAGTMRALMWPRARRAEDDGKQRCRARTVPHHAALQCGPRDRVGPSGGQRQTL
jgi:hypothetical protein